MLRNADLIKYKTSPPTPLRTRKRGETLTTVKGGVRSNESFVFYLIHDHSNLNGENPLSNLTTE